MNNQVIDERLDKLPIKKFVLETYGCVSTRKNN